ncbi:aminoglycoside phosphotransferase [Streptomyces sp. NPDC101150]|uniref:aminoglycoside phosphotransferase n=1 Tax=Streptomyces sp. NPDC101150 TaxID=3366114 RepID=UPI00380CC2B0
MDRGEKPRTAAAKPAGSLASERLYRQVRDGLACSEEVQLVAQPWREAERTGLTTRAVEERLDAYATALLDALG